jgi:hypothetical protein
LRMPGAKGLYLRGLETSLHVAMPGGAIPPWPLSTFHLTRPRALTTDRRHGHPKFSLWRGQYAVEGCLHHHGAAMRGMRRAGRARSDGARMHSDSLCRARHARRMRSAS